jgi:hypothetical protein
MSFFMPFLINMSIAMKKTYLHCSKPKMTK